MLHQDRILLWVAALALITISLDTFFEPISLDLLTDKMSATNLKFQSAGNDRQGLWSVSTETEELSANSVRAAKVAIPIDHSRPNEDSFMNRYWVNSEFYMPGGPVFVHDAGEVDAESSAERYLGGPATYLHDLLKEFHGVGIVWEHRYYGKSLPYPINRSTDIDMFQYLNLEQSLADLPYFAWNSSHDIIPELNLSPASTPWIMIGCSYSGLRAAVSRIRYPETIYAAYVASAPIQLQVELSSFFDPIYEKLIDRGYESCAQDLHAAISHLDVHLSTADGAQLVKQQFLGSKSTNNSNGDFTLAIANIYSNFQSYGILGGKYSLDSLCTYMKRSSDNSDIEPSALSVRYGAQSALERLASWPQLVTIVNNHFRTNCTVSNSSHELDCDLSQPDTNGDGISWTWQMCSELGLFVTQNSGVRSLVSRYQNLEYRQSLCDRQFSHARSNKSLPALPPVDIINEQTGGRFMRPSNTFWTAGEYDPWRSLTILSAKSLTSSGIEGISVSQTIPFCNTSTRTDVVFGYVLKDAQHCLDYTVTSTEAATAQAYFTQALKEWLPCYRSASRL